MEERGERFRFIRGNVFDGLDDYRNSEPLRIRRRNLSFPQSTQEILPIPGMDYSNRVLYTIGTFFEILSQGVYGGRHKLFQEVNGEGDQLFNEPDLTNPRTCVYREVKSFAPGRGVILPDRQIERYVKLQFKGKNVPSIRFEFFRHGLTAPVKNFSKLKIEELVQKLSENVGFMISLPLSVVYAIYSHSPKEDNFLYRYEVNPNEPAYQPFNTRFNSRGLNNLLAYPEETLEKFHLDPDSFLFRRRKFSSNMIIGGMPIFSFPALIVEEKSPMEEFFILQERSTERLKRMEEQILGYTKHELWEDIKAAPEISEEKIGDDFEVPF